MHKIAFLLLGAALAPTALTMIWAPLLWYDWFPGVAERGAFNAHFVRDLGCAFLVAALSFLWAVKAQCPCSIGGDRICGISRAPRSGARRGKQPQALTT